MKTTVEIPDLLFRQAKATAAQQGIPLKSFLAEAVRDRLRKSLSASSEKPWMAAFGGLRSLHAETRRIQRIIAKEFSAIDEEEWG